MFQSANGCLLKYYSDGKTSFSPARRALVVCQFLELRLRLQSALELTPGFEDVTSVHSVEEAEALYKQGHRYGTHIFADSLEGGDITKFIDKVRALSKTHEEVFVMLLGSNDTKSLSVAHHMFGGIHGFLCEPFTGESIAESLALARAVVKQRSSLRLRTAAGLMLNDIVEEFERESGAISPREGDLWDRVQHTCDRYKALTGESISVAVVEPLKHNDTTDRIAGYTGVSKRVRERLRVRFKEKLRAVKGK